MKLIFEKSNGFESNYIEKCDVPKYDLCSEVSRNISLKLPQISESEISRHYTELANKTFGINDGFYPLGSCTMKYNPKINEKIASLEGFSKIHPLQPTETVKGCMEVLILAEKYLCELTGMKNMTFQPAAGAQGEFTGLLMIKAYHMKRGDNKRLNIIIPDCAHGTNPASAAMAGFNVINIPSTKEGLVDLDVLRNTVNNQTAGLMLTNPNTLGIFDKNILEITKIVHEVGGLNYYDGANFNAIMGIVRPGDMGFDVVHLNLHKTFSTPHGGGGPGSGPVGCNEKLSEFIPGNKNLYLKRVKSFYGNFSVVIKALSYIMILGKEGLLKTSQNAVLNANYMMDQMKKTYKIINNGHCMHEFVVSLENLKNETNVSALDIAKALLDEGIHPPTMYFPNIVSEALMIEPTETETKTNIDEAVSKMIKVYNLAKTERSLITNKPNKLFIGRVDEVSAARNLILKY